VTDISPVRHLSKRSRALYRRIQSDYELGDHHRRLLQLLCEALDRADAAQAAINEHGLTCEDRFGQTKPRPEVAIKRDAEVSAARLLREIDLDASTISDVRPPRIAGRYAP
jgi:phage terminase small subunit